MAVDGWEETTLENVLSKIEGGGTPSKKNADFWNGSIPWASVKDLVAYKLEDTVDHISPSGLDNSASKLIPANTIIIGTRMAVGKAVRFSKPVAINQDLRAVYPSKNLQVDFLHQWFIANEEHISSLGSGSTVKGIRLETLKGLPIQLPPLPEQKKIAKVLEGVDDAIAKTEAVIAQTERVKQGIFGAFFSHGVWDKAPLNANKYELRLLDEVAKRGSGHTPSKSYAEYWDGGVKWVSLQDTKKLDKLYISKTEAEISLKGLDNSSAVLHPAGTVVLSRDATVGRSAILLEDMAVSQHFIAWQCNKDLINYYLYYWLQFMKPVFEQIGVGSTIKTIGLPFFKKLKIPLPSMPQQQAVSRSLVHLDEIIFSNQKILERLHITKKGLMSDLLTGRVRVSIPSTKQAEAA